jgi:hypothetical protein
MGQFKAIGSDALVRAQAKPPTVAASNTKYNTPVREHRRRFIENIMGPNKAIGGIFEIDGPI